MERATLLSLTLCICSSSVATTWTVDDDGKADFQRIQDAIDASSDMDVIFVHEGTYYENINFLGKWIQVQGENQATTIIDGGLNNAPVVTFNSGETFWSVLSTFTIQNGSGKYWVDPVFGQEKCGGGIYCEESSPFIELCDIKNNQAWGGGGIFVNDGDPFIMFSTIENNIAEGHGGGIFISGNVYGTLDSLEVNNNLANWGGGMTCTDSSDPSILNSTFALNETLNVGGGVYVRSSSSPTFIACSFESNIQTSNPLGSGGGACVYGAGTGGGPCYPTFNDCLFENNSVNGDGGGLAAAYDAHPKVNDCYFIGNSSGRSGGGIACVADEGYLYPSKAELINVDVQFNHANEEGGGIHVRWSEPLLEQVTIQNNDANNTGGGINFFESPLSLLSYGTVCDNSLSQINGTFTDGGNNEIHDSCSCDGDVNGDGFANVSDVLAVVDSWGVCSGCPADLNDDGVVNVEDLLEVVGNWGPC
ncbi:MAG: pectinesterase family protein [Phycisphaerales bacterium]|nr:pectinesterase family protein [Phycisphaerales bacterium]